jgi:hypothetical protein
LDVKNPGARFEQQDQAEEQAGQGQQPRGGAQPYPHQLNLSQAQIIGSDISKSGGGSIMHFGAG